MVFSKCLWGLGPSAGLVGSAARTVRATDAAVGRGSGPFAGHRGGMAFGRGRGRVLNIDRNELSNSRRSK